MTNISTSDIQHLASLSSLALADDEVDGLRQDLENIIGYIEQLGELDTSGVESTYQVTGLENVWREDEVQSGISRDELLELAPEKQNNQVKVPQVL
ncbi:glutamyl-tRNA amidotransferase [Candidatus Nanosynbacter lyticus]|uniref:Aspartyl/glutamyl-tRNA(Asn/Gln) amidotransferase subunit C n=1 Tax=Candidatus Nanosynbacter lyticus TaxID=2093824 RepID=A0A6S4GQ33_9BACT|nr:Asp-tRNA(Asn)/Glu-tRNA(Gln) amidotransferase subunit GatC [Candidatus Nanosynbacter lyticus]AJA06529.1 glutamyl-tRNA amidotransferase [Candidatus Nanosynbacter lyticus]QCT41610.1 Asp-tRNA(Asn)/Glu-tRNA(Gln) amidotransferase subunit GatC [TM7 phylum sp. oral taxon 952]